MDVYELNLATSGKLKVRATARLAEGDPESVFQACVLLHEAARLERRAVDALSHRSPITALSASVEECWCLVEGRDPPGAGDVWSRILEERSRVESKEARAALARLQPAFEETTRRFQDLLRASPTLMRFRPERGLVPQSGSEQRAAMREVVKVLEVFPGIAALWGLRARFEDGAGSPDKAWKSLGRALQLEPENHRLRALSILSAAEGLPVDKADSYLAEVRPSLVSAPAEVCSMYAFAEITLARKGKATKERWKRASEAVELALPRIRSEGLRRDMTAVRLFVEQMRAGRKAGPEILYRAGLGSLAVTASGDVFDVLLARAQAHIREEAA
jgi:hypothetical protein